MSTLNIAKSNERFRFIFLLTTHDFPMYTQVILAHLFCHITNKILHNKDLSHQLRQWLMTSLLRS